MICYNGNKIKMSIDGTSHGKEIVLKVQGVENFNYDEKELYKFIERRKPSGVGTTSRHESDIPKITYDKGYNIRIKNTDVKSEDYKNLLGIPRPSHSDIGRYFKNGETDFTGGGEYSGRLTALLVVFGGIAKQILKAKYDTDICAYLQTVGKVKAKSYKDGYIPLEDSIYKGGFPSLYKQEEMIKEIESAVNSGNSVGSKIECIVYGFKKGIGGAYFEGLEGKISSLVFSVPAVKGIEFGKGFNLCESYGSETNDEMYFNGGEIEFKTNNSGGIYGGISCGDITFSVAVKPTPSIEKEQDTVDLINKKNVKISVHGRHDGCIGVRCVPVIEAVTAIALLDEVEN